MDNPTFQLILDGEVIFQSTKKWLFPLFDLEDYLAIHQVKMAQTEARDKVIGKAAALLIIRLGAGKIHGDVMSELARTVLEKANIPFTFATLVDQIDCQTEQILLEIDDPDTAYQILCKRANQDS